MSQVAEPARTPIEEPESTAEERTAALARRARYVRNLQWYSDRVDEIVAAHRGLYICVAGRELFVGTEMPDVLQRARSAHPEDAGAMFSKYIPTSPEPVRHAS